MAKVSVLIPARNEPYLTQTLRDLYKNAAGEIEVIVILDGEKQPEYKLPKYRGLQIHKTDRIRGLRYCVNMAAKLATGKYIMKMDAHCTIGEGWDEILQADCADNWMVAPSRFMWDAPTWTFKTDADGTKTRIDAHYYFYPYIRPYNPRLTSRPWPERAEARKDVLIDTDMSCQGSLWFMHRSLFERLGGMNEYGYGTFSSEPEELGLKIQLGPVGGEVMRNKNTWFAHWQKPAAQWWNMPADLVGRVSDYERLAGNWYCFDHWYNNRWSGRVHDFEWLIEKFWPVPTWPDNWRALPAQYTRYAVKEYPPYIPESSATMDIMGDAPFRVAKREHERARA